MLKGPIFFKPAMIIGGLKKRWPSRTHLSTQERRDNLGISPERRGTQANIQHCRTNRVEKTNPSDGAHGRCRTKRTNGAPWTEGGSRVNPWNKGLAQISLTYVLPALLAVPVTAEVTKDAVE